MPESTDSGSLNLSDFAKLVPGIVDLINGVRGQGKNQGATAASMADPYNKYRGEAADQLHTLVNDPSSIEKDPGFQYGLTHALDAGNRSSAAMGQGNAGNNILSQADIGQRYAASAYDTKFGQLSKLALGDPTAASKDYLIGNTLDEQNTAGGVGSLTSFLSSPAGVQLIKSLGSGAAQLFKLISGSGDMSPEALKQLHDLFNVGGGLDNFNDSGYTPGGTEGLFGDTAGEVNPDVPFITDTGTEPILNVGVTGQFDPSYVEDIFSP
jgi:hypothetical protein